MKYWIIENGVTVGPFTLDELRDKAPAPDMPVWRSGLTDWIHISDLPEWRELNGEVEVVTVIEDTPVREEVSNDVPVADACRCSDNGRVGNISEEGPAPTYLGWSIAAALACCTLAGIVAVVYSMRVRDANARGFYAQARKESRVVELLLITAITLGLVTLPFSIIIALL